MRSTARNKASLLRISWFCCFLLAGSSPLECSAIETQQETSPSVLENARALRRLAGEQLSNHNIDCLETYLDSLYELRQAHADSKERLSVLIEMATLPERNSVQQWRFASACDGIVIENQEDIHLLERARELFVPIVPCSDAKLLHLANQIASVKCSGGDLSDQLSLLKSLVVSAQDFSPKVSLECFRIFVKVCQNCPQLPDDVKGRSALAVGQALVHVPVSEKQGNAALLQYARLFMQPLFKTDSKPDLSNLDQLKELSEMVMARCEVADALPISKQVVLVSESNHIDNADLLARERWNLGLCLLLSGDTTGADKYLIQSQRLPVTPWDRNHLNRSHVVYIASLIKQSRWEEARNECLKGIKWLDAFSGPERTCFLGVLEAQLGETYFRQGSFQSARTHLMEADRRFQLFGDTSYQMWQYPMLRSVLPSENFVLERLATVSAKLGQLAQSRQYLKILHERESADQSAFQNENNIRYALQSQTLSNTEIEALSEQMFLGVTQRKLSAKETVLFTIQNAEFWCDFGSFRIGEMILKPAFKWAQTKSGQISEDFRQVLLFEQAYCYIQLCDFAAADRSLAELQLSNLSSDLNNTVLYLTLKGKLELLQGHYAEAEKVLRQALDMRAELMAYDYKTSTSIPK